MPAKGQEGEGIQAIVGTFDRSISLTQPEEIGRNHIGWTGLHKLSATPGITGSAEPPGAGVLQTALEQFVG